MPARTEILLRRCQGQGIWVGRGIADRPLTGGTRAEEYHEASEFLFTGGAGKAGRHAVPYLVAAGYEVHNVDLTPLESPGVTNLDRRYHR
jgi:hypothetical protein